MSRYYFKPIALILTNIIRCGRIFRMRNPEEISRREFLKRVRRGVVAFGAGALTGELLEEGLHVALEGLRTADLAAQEQVYHENVTSISASNFFRILNSGDNPGIPTPEKFLPITYVIDGLRVRYIGDNSHLFPSIDHQANSIERDPNDSVRTLSFSEAHVYELSSGDARPLVVFDYNQEPYWDQGDGGTYVLDASSIKDKGSLSDQQIAIRLVKVTDRNGDQAKDSVGNLQWQFMVVSMPRVPSSGIPQIPSAPFFPK